MSLDHILLGLLRQPASGYDLKKVFDERIEYFWAAELSQIYPTLKRIEKRGWVRGRQAVSSRGPGRRVYETTPAGRQALRDWLARGPEIGDERFAYLAQIYLMDELGDLKQTLRFFTVLRDDFVRKLEALRQLERYWAEADPRYPDALPSPDFHVQLTLRLGLVSLGGHVKSCDESIRRVRARMEREKHAPVQIPKASGGKAVHSSPGRGSIRQSANRQRGKSRAKR